MKRQISIAAVFVVGCLAGGVGSQFVHAPPARAGTNPQRWDHYCIHGELDEAGKSVVDAGKAGWELVGVTSLPRGIGSHVLFCFKRPA